MSESELEARDVGELREMVAAGGRVEAGLSRQFATLIADYARATNYEQVNWLRGAIAVYVANRAEPTYTQLGSAHGSGGDPA